MNTNMNVTMRQLMTAFIILFLLISGVAAYIQIGNQAFFNGPTLASGQYDQRKCPPYDSPLRGKIFDRNGNLIAQTVPDPNAPCGYRRQYASWVASSGLAPLIGYFSYQYGTGGVEASFNDQLAGIQTGETFQNASAKLLHEPRYGSDLYLTIDKDVQQAASNYYDSSYLAGAPVCQAAGSNPPGSLIVEDPKTGEILAMVSKPSYDPNKIDDPQYWSQLNNNPEAPLLNHATQGLYDPGSTFKTMTLAAALDTGTYSLDSTFSFNDATDFNINGDDIKWFDYFNGTWNGILSAGSFPLSLQDAFAYSDNTIFARAAVKVGADQWLNYARKFGIATPGTDVQPVPFDAPYNQSRAYNTFTNGKATQFTPELLAESGFGQGQLLITPLTMTEISATMANNGILYEPHVAYKVVPHGTNKNDVLPTAPVMFGGQPVLRPETAQSVRKAMWAVVDHGTAFWGLPTHISQSGVFEGGKTGTGQTENANPETWWISLAPDDQAPGGSAAQLNVTVMKEHSGEGACQVYVADDTYKYAFSHHLVPQD